MHEGWRGGGAGGSRECFPSGGLNRRRERCGGGMWKGCEEMWKVCEEEVGGVKEGVEEGVPEGVGTVSLADRPADVKAAEAPRRRRMGPAAGC